MPASYKAILKRRLYYYSHMMRPTDQEMTAIEKILVVHYSQSPGRGIHHPMEGTWGSTRAGHKAGGSRERCGQEHLLWFPQEEMGKTGYTAL